jgi:hypothetical protein
MLNAGIGGSVTSLRTESARDSARRLLPPASRRAARNPLLEKAVYFVRGRRAATRQSVAMAAA